MLDKHITCSFLATLARRAKRWFLCNLERKLDIIIELVPFEMKEISQIRISEEFALRLVAFLVPTNVLADLAVPMSASCAMCLKAGL